MGGESSGATDQTARSALALKQGEDGYDALVRTLAHGWQ